MKKQIIFSALTALLLLHDFLSPVQAQQLHRLPIQTTQDLHAYFAWTGKNKPIISGHRGGYGQGLSGKLDCYV